MKYSCPICGYVHEGENAPEICPQCKQKITWKELSENGPLTFVTEHEIGIAKGTGEEMIKDLNAHFMGEATEVGGDLQGSPVWQALAGHKRRIPLAVVLPPQPGALGP